MDRQRRRRQRVAVGSDLEERRLERDLLVERDEREPVGCAETLDQERGAAASDVELRTRHRAGAVEDEGERQRPPLRRGRRVQGR